MITRSLLVFLSIFLSQTSFAQGDYGLLHITVLDADTNQPIPFSNVYLNKTTIGASTNEQGEATITKIPFGTYQVVVSEVGHISQQRDLVIGSTELVNITVKLKTQMLDVVTVVAKHDSKWKHELSRFEKLFFGLDHFKQCEITNPWALEFADEKGQFVVKSKEALKIRNNYLGYDLDFAIKNCYFNAETFNITGYARFEEQKGDEKELAKWKKNREKTYRGSPQHFFKTVFDSTFHTGGYEIFTDITGQDKLLRTPVLNDNINKAIVRDTIVKRVTRRKDGMYNLRLPTRLEIHYQFKSAYPPVYSDVNHAISWMEVRKGTTVVVNSSGFIQNSNDVRLSGAMSNFRVAEWLPLDYRYSGESTPDQIIPPAKQIALLEKPYIHTDRDYYYSDETMWLKGYMSYVLPNLEDTLSKTVYVELSDATGKVVATNRYAIEDGKFNGDISFNRDWKPGLYQLRAYTSWMLNFDKRLIFTKTVDLLGEKQAVKMPASYTPAADTLPNIWLRTDKGSYSAREQITVKIDVIDSLEFPTASNLSISVTDVEQAVPHKNEKSIVSSYFFDNEARNISATKLSHEIEYGIPFSGRFLLGKKSAQGTLTFYQDGITTPLVMMTGEDGRFKENLSFTDTLQLWAWGVGVTKKKEKGIVVVDSSRVICPKLPLEPLALDVYTADNNNGFKRMSLAKSNVLPEVSLTAKKIVPQKSSARPVGYGDHRITGEWLNSNNFQNVFDAIAAKVPGTIYDITGPAIYFVTGTANNMTNATYTTAVKSSAPIPKIASMYGSSGTANSIPNNTTNPPVYVVDNVVMEAYQLTNIPMQSIDHIDITKFTTNSKYGKRADGGLIEIYTKAQGTRDISSFDKSKLQEIKWVGYSTTSRFESPDYSKPPENDYYDNRATIYWSPSVTTSGKETASVSFYAADTATKYRIVVEGVTATGEPVHAEKIIEIIKGR